MKKSSVNMCLLLLGGLLTSMVHSVRMHDMQGAGYGGLVTCGYEAQRGVANIRAQFEKGFESGLKSGKNGVSTLSEDIIAKFEGEDGDVKRLKINKPRLGSAHGNNLLDDSDTESAPNSPSTASTAEPDSPVSISAQSSDTESVSDKSSVNEEEHETSSQVSSSDLESLKKPISDYLSDLYLRAFKRNSEQKANFLDEETLKNEENRDTARQYLNALYSKVSKQSIEDKKENTKVTEAIIPTVREEEKREAEHITLTTDVVRIEEIEVNTQSVSNSIVEEKPIVSAKGKIAEVVRVQEVRATIQSPPKRNENSHLDTDVVVVEKKREVISEELNNEKLKDQDAEKNMNPQFSTIVTDFIKKISENNIPQNV